MQIKIEPHDPLPVHIQLKEQIRFLILNGDLAPGARLPTIRQLAGFLRINRNTVLRAYQELVREGLIECRQGRGCEVIEQIQDGPQAVPTHLLAVIDNAIDRASELGVSPDDFATLAYARARQRGIEQPRPHLVFVECEARIAADFARVIRERLDVKVTPMVLQDLGQPTKEVEEKLGQVQVVATTFFHIHQVKRLLASTHKKVVGLTVKPHLEALIQVAQIPQGTPAALVCLNERSARLMEQSLKNAGLKSLDASPCGVDDPQKLSETLEQVATVVASDHVADELRPLLRPDQELIVLNYLALDEGGINLLRSVLQKSETV